jgi:hypothetical protein
MFDPARLPIACATRLPTNNKPILIKAGVKGYFPAPTPDFDPDTYNRDMGVTPAQLRAMEIGSIFGFEVPGANPEYHEKLNDKETKT